MGGSIRSRREESRERHVYAPPTLLVDLYELTMAESYVREALADLPATFQLLCRQLPEGWGYLVAAGLDDALGYLERLRFDPDELDYLVSTGLFSDRLIERLSRLRFTGDVRAMPEGTFFFAGEPVLEVTAPLLEAQLVETVVLNQVHVQSLLASKAARCVDAADGRRLVDFSLRRAHGGEAGLKAARASYLAGFDATSNVLAGRLFGIPLAGTMAHSYVECFPDEVEAFTAFARAYPQGSTLLVDTYDTVEGARHAANVAQAVASQGGRVAGVRLDSGEFLRLSVLVRQVLNQAGLGEVAIFASGTLDEREIASLLAQGAPIDGFGIGSKLGVSADAPFLDMAYKLAVFDGRPVLKLSAGKATLPGAKQVWRRRDAGRIVRDLITLADEGPMGGADPLLQPVMMHGERVPLDSLESARARVATQRAMLTPDQRLVDAKPCAVDVSQRLVALDHAVRGGLPPVGTSAGIG
jgi:nicotinate phosphoribosyltransferase